MNGFELEIACTSSLEVEDDDRYLARWGAKVLAWSIDDDGGIADDEMKEVGVLQGYKLHIDDFLDSGSPCNLWNLCDDESSELEELSRLLFNVDGEWTDWWDENAAHSFGNNVFFFTCIDLKPEYRGSGLGAKAAARFLDLVSQDCGMTLCKPFPLQFSCKDQGGSPEFKKAMRKLRNYWKKQGFKGTTGSSVMFKIRPL